MTEPVATLTGVHKSYQMDDVRVPVLQGIDLSVRAGLFTVVLGPSGSGKSTMLNLIGCIDRPDRGGVTVAGTDVNALNDDQLADFRAQHVGFIFQSFNLIPVLSTYENVEYPLVLAGMAPERRARRVNKLLELVGLADRRSHRPNELSGGQQQRVAIARAIVSDPTFLICDEPTGDLDRHSAEEILNLLKMLNREHGKTIIMVTHDPKAAEYATHTIHLDKGELVDAPAAAH